MEDGHVGRSEPAIQEDSMDAEREDDDDSGGDDEDDDVDDAVASHDASAVVGRSATLLTARLPVTAAAAAASSQPTDYLSPVISQQPPLPQLDTGSDGHPAKQSPGRQQQQLLNKLDVLVLGAASTSSSSTTSSTVMSSGSSSTLAVTRLELVHQSPRLNKMTCDTEDPKPGPSNSAADFDLEVID